MMRRENEKGKADAIKNFSFSGNLVSVEPYGSGHINDTYLLTFEEPGMGHNKKILQHMNRQILLCRKM